MRPPLPTPHPFTGLDLATLLEQRAQATPDKPFLIWCPAEGPSRTWTYAGFAEKAARIAGGLAARGVQIGRAHV